MTISVDELNELLKYNPCTGKLIWRERQINTPRDKAFNARHAGQVVYEEPHKGYGRVAVLGKRYKAHRIVWALHYGEWPKDQIDHINGVRNDNRIENLRDVTHKENCRNVRRLDSNMSGVAGVRWAKRRRKWEAGIGVDNKWFALGYFDLFADAVAAREAAEVEYGFHPNHGR